jgi:hypothetical protein
MQLIKFTTVLILLFTLPSFALDARKIEQLKARLEKNLIEQAQKPSPRRKRYLVEEQGDLQEQIEILRRAKR